MGVRLDLRATHLGQARRLIALACLQAAVWMGSVDVRAQTSPTERDDAALAYDRGATAYRAHNYAEAAEWFERANERMPSTVALVSALRAYRGARAVQRAGTIALQLDGEAGLTAQTASIVRQSLTTARARYVQVEIACNEACVLDVNGSSQVFARFFAEPNQDLTVVATFASGERTQHVTTRAGVVHSLAFEAPEGSGAPGDGVAETDELPLEEGENPYRISRMRFLSRPRATFFTSLAATATIASIATWSALDARGSRDDAAAAAAAGAPPEDVAMAAAGHTRDVRRTRGYVGFTSVMVVLSAAVASLTDWTPHGAPSTDAALDISTSGAELTVRHRF